MKTSQNLFRTKIALKILLISILSISFFSANAQRHHKVKKYKYTPSYRYTKLPRWGNSYNITPKNAFLITHSGKKYHYHSGIYYKRSGANYIITKAPIGIRIRTLPKERIKCNIKGKKYFYYYGTFYIKTDEADEYITVDPPKGAIVDALPEGYKDVTVDGNEYYEFEGILYKPVISENDEELFEVTGKM
jgi:hypothetical protein